MGPTWAPPCDAAAGGQVGLLAAVWLAACGGPSAAPAPQPTALASPRTNDLSVSGLFADRLQGESTTLESNAKPICGGRVSGDPQGVSYLMAWDASVHHWVLNLVVHSFTRPGTFAVGSYPNGSKTAPAVLTLTLVVAEIPQRPIQNGVNFFGWGPTSGTVTVDRGGRSGTLRAHLISNDTAVPLDVEGPWACPAAG